MVCVAQGEERAEAIRIAVSPALHYQIHFLYLSAALDSAFVRTAGDDVR